MIYRNCCSINAILNLIVSAWLVQNQCCKKACTLHIYLINQFVMTQRPIGKARDKSRIQLDGTQLFLQSSIQINWNSFQHHKLPRLSFCTSIINQTQNSV